MLKQQEYTTSHGYDISYIDVYKGLSVMNRKHKNCNWINNDSYPEVRVEGYYWLKEVYFKSGSSLIDADIKFFESIVEDYKQVCDEKNISYKIKALIEDDMTIKEFAIFVNRKKGTVKNVFVKLPPEQKSNCYYHNGKRYISSSVCDNLCRKHFKSRYLDYLEELYIMFKNRLSEKGVEIKYGI